MTKGHHIEVDPYLKETLAENMKSMPRYCSFLGTAEGFNQGFAFREEYFIRPDANDMEHYFLWAKTVIEAVDLLMDKPYQLLGRLRGPKMPAIKAGEVLILALWRARNPEIIWLKGLNGGGILTNSTMKNILRSYRDHFQEPVIPRRAKAVQGELYHENGTLKYSGDLVNGVPHGKGTGYWEDGNLWYEGKFRRGKPDLEGRFFYRNGVLRHEGRHSKGLPCGKGKEYYENGKVRFEGLFGNQDGMKYYYGKRSYRRGRYYDERGSLLHEGKFDPLSHATPLEKKE